MSSPHHRGATVLHPEQKPTASISFYHLLLVLTLCSPLHEDGLSHRGRLCGSNILPVKWPHWPRAVHRPLQQRRGGSVGVHQKREAVSCMQKPVFMFCRAFWWEHWCSDAERLPTLLNNRQTIYIYIHTICGTKLNKQVQVIIKNKSNPAAPQKNKLKKVMWWNKNEVIQYRHVLSALWDILGVPEVTDSLSADRQNVRTKTGDRTP